LQYAGKGSLRYLLGTEYTSLRKPFWDVPEKSVSGSIANILVTLGGSESAELVTMLVGFICKNFPQWEKNVVVGSSFSYRERVEKVKDGRTHIFHNIDEKTMKDLMLGSDIAISSGGQTLYELARVGVPVIAISIVDHQLRNIKGLEQAGILRFAGCSGDGMLPDNVYTAIEYLLPKEARSRLSTAGRRLIDGRGSRRIRDIIHEML
ncbi:MAG: UDP-2,4-diacetamido-2,4,6-trideoxy-beta-L-altropyranose hydrolase, partial [Candidatus Omnitrophica bacterium]|nr:UDP-2,4-diacetamido-2,4,6-trideoxy-beta-L-altropyranose hydrolase [Candidatus Omnitrophota bacterium]MBU1808382.1 UDP-2,4-diacetamido-2,4,6-trideoxy-beta-L-altropyranose hydrolase [Candidatus Omnitrophota bacterium]